MVSTTSWMPNNATHSHEHAKMTSFRSYTSSNYVRNIHLIQYNTIQYNMWWLIQNILFSACLIVMIHYLYIYFETTLTTPKVKDLIRGQKHEYKSLLESINKKIDQPMLSSSSSSLSSSFPPSPPSSSSQIPTEPLGITQSSDDMKSDLKQYLREIGQQYQPS